jgi:LmbE family N-acetylglucosaminyl deacetylase
MRLSYSKSILAVFFIASCMQSAAQVSNGNTAADIYLQLQKMNVLGSVLYVGAHPDDENTRLLTWLSKEKKYRTAYLSLTRGDGGQNLIGDEQGVTLGMVRTEELLAARSVDGAEQFFTRAYDFGFSKNPDETFKFWDKEQILSDVVFVIRYFRPDVIITRFPEDGRAGHGHHSASAILAREGFFAAADPNRFPEHFKWGLKPWQAKRILWNTFNFGGNNTINNNQYKVDVGGYNTLLGKSYGEISAQSRSQHKSQGFGVPSQRGESFEYFAKTAGDTVFTDMMDGVDLTWKRTGDAAVEYRINTLLQNFNFTEPEKSVAGLLDLRDHFRTNLNESPWVTHKMKELNKLISACSGLYFEATTTQPFAVTGDSLKINFSVINRSHVPVSQLSISYIDTTLKITDTLKFNVAKNISLTRKVRSNFMQDQPYWLREQMTEGAFKIDAQALLMNPHNDPNDITVSYFFRDKVPVVQKYPLQYKHTDPVKGELYEPVITVPAVIVSAFPAVVLNNVVPTVTPRVTVRYQSLSEKGTQQGQITFNTGETVLVRNNNVLSLAKNKITEVPFLLDTLLVARKNTEISAGVVLKDSTGYQQTYSNYLRLVKYDHIPAVHYFYQAKVKVVTDEVRVVGKRVGYIRGAGDNVPDALIAMGYEVVMLNPEDLILPKLASLDAVITGIRAYNVHDWLEDKYEVLMNYVKNGGNLIVQYNTSNFISNVTRKMGPYSFDISRNRVTDEKAKVEFLLPAHQVLNYPNKITEKDFENWVQERGIYFAEKTDPAYETPLQMNDPGEAGQKGSLIIGNYGKGKFVYTGLVFFRELPAGVPGAYRLLANIIALNQKKGF